MEYTIREAEEKDIKALCGLLSLLFSIETDFRIDRKKQEVGLRLLLENRGNCRVFAAEAAGKVIGMVTGQLIISTAEGGASLKIEDMIVAKEYRRMGIGKALLDAVAKWGKETGVKRMELLADRTNTPGLEFYEKLGWKSTRMICLCLTPPAGTPLH